VSDPPRAGTARQCRILAEAGPPLPVAVSCNPQSFARDARILADGGYQLADVTPADRPPWSHRLEPTARPVRD